MKLQTTLSKFLLLTAVTATALAGCGTNDKIPYNELEASKEVITIAQAKALQKRFIATYDQLNKMVKDSFVEKRFDIPHAETFGKDAIALLLAQGGDSIRIYYGIDSLGECHLVLLPVDKNGKDIYKKLITKKSVAIHVPGISSAQAQGTGDDNEAVETGQICPPCLINNPPPGND
jgi:hypothetical protein